MALTETVSIDQIEIVSDWNIQVRQATVIEKDGVQVARSFHRWVLTPDMDISGQEQKVQDICNVAWTDEVKSAYETFKAEQISIQQLSFQASLKALETEALKGVA